MTNEQLTAALKKRIETGDATPATLEETRALIAELTRAHEATVRASLEAMRLAGFRDSLTILLDAARRVVDSRGDLERAVAIATLSQVVASVRRGEGSSPGSALLRKSGE